MARVKPISLSLLPFIWRAYWRDLTARGAWRNANLLVVGIATLFMIPSQIAASIFAITSIQSGAVTRGMLITQVVLTTVLMGWLLLPVLINSVSARGQGIRLLRLSQFPLTIAQLFEVGVVNTLIQPVYWLLVLVSAFALIPLGMAPYPGYALAAGVLFIAVAALISWTIGLVGTALLSSRRGRELALGLFTFTMAGMFFLLRGDIDLSDGLLTLEVFGRSFLLTNAEGTEGLFVTLRNVTPATWTMNAAHGDRPFLWLGVLAACALASFGLSAWSLKRLIVRPPEGIGGGRARRRAIGAVPGLPIEVGVSAVKEFRYLLRTMDALLGIAIGVVAAVIAFVQPERGVIVLGLAAPVIITMEMAMPLNAFGLDKQTVDRYRLLPLSGKTIIFSKNIAYFLVVAIELFPIVVAGLIQVGLVFVLALLSACAAMCLVTSAWGNVLSIREPAPRDFFNFDSREQAGGALGMIFATLVWLAPLGLGALAWSLGGAIPVLLVQVALLAIALVIYRKLLPRAGRLFEESAEVMRTRLSG